MEFPVYKIEPSQSCYRGSALVAAKSAASANEFIDDFIRRDGQNKRDSWGYAYVTEDDKIDYLFSTVTGIIDYGIQYCG